MYLWNKQINHGSLRLAKVSLGFPSKSLMNICSHYERFTLDVDCQAKPHKPFYLPFVLLLIIIQQSLTITQLL